MNKEIEELAKDLLHSRLKKQEECNATECEKCEYFERAFCQEKLQAKEMISQGYIKIQAHEVVIPKDEYERLNDTVNIRNVRKETAREIFAKIDEELGECTIVNEGGYGWNYQGYEATDLRKRLTKIAKQFGVEVEE